eukprot:12564556-Alexandrium_andersonii.AAC.1
MSASLVGSEMCIRDRCRLAKRGAPDTHAETAGPQRPPLSLGQGRFASVSYTHLTLPTICSV